MAIVALKGCVPSTFLRVFCIRDVYTHEHFLIFVRCFPSLCQPSRLSCSHTFMHEPEKHYGTCLTIVYIAAMLLVCIYTVSHSRSRISPSIQFNFAFPPHKNTHFCVIPLLFCLSSIFSDHSLILSQMVVVVVVTLVVLVCLLLELPSSWLSLCAWNRSRTQHAQYYSLYYLYMSAVACVVPAHNRQMTARSHQKHFTHRRRNKKNEKRRPRKCSRHFFLSSSIACRYLFYILYTIYSAEKTLGVKIENGVLGEVVKKWVMPILLISVYIIVYAMFSQSPAKGIGRSCLQITSTGQELYISTISIFYHTQNDVSDRHKLLYII